MAIKFVLLLVAGCLTCEMAYGGPANFMVLGDWGMGNDQQHSTAARMKQMASDKQATFVVNVGDNFYKTAGFMGSRAEPQGGVTNLSDPLWKLYFEDVYNGPLQEMEFRTVLGNHDYMGNTTAQLEYHSLDKRWILPSRYYSQTLSLSQESATVVFLDTNVFIQDYIDKPENEWMKEQLAQQNRTAQLEWLDATLAASKSKWKIAVGHHPIVSHPGSTLFKSNTGVSMEMVHAVLQKHGVQVYFCGHVHDLEHSSDDDMNYFISGGGGFGKVYTLDEKMQSKLNFLSKDAGFMVVSLDDSQMNATYVNTKGDHIYNYIVKP